MNVQVREQFWSASENSENLGIGLRGRLCKYDNDGDLEIRFHGFSKTQFFFAEDVHKLEFQLDSG